MNGSLYPRGEQAQDYFKCLKNGETYHADIKQPRNAKFHAKYFALLNYAFSFFEEADIKYKGEPVSANFDRFRNDITILAGFYEATYDINLKIHLKAKSISFALMKEDEFEKLYNRTIDVILAKVLTRQTKTDINSAVNNIMNFA